MNFGEIAVVVLMPLAVCAILVWGMRRRPDKEQTTPVTGVVLPLPREDQDR